MGLIISQMITDDYYRYQFNENIAFALSTLPLHINHTSKMFYWSFHRFISLKDFTQENHLLQYLMAKKK